MAESPPLTPYGIKLVRAAIGKRRLPRGVTFEMHAKETAEAFKVSDEDKALALLAGSVPCPGWRHAKNKPGADKCILCRGSGMVPLKEVPHGFLGLWITMGTRQRLGQSLDTEDVINELDGGDGTTGSGGILEEM